MTEFSDYVALQGKIEKALTAGTDMPDSGPSVTKSQALVTAAKAAFAGEPNNEFKRAHLNRALAIRRDVRMRTGRYGALHLSAALGLRANFETGYLLA